METIVSQFRTEGLSFINGRHHYYGDLVIEGDGAIWDNIVVHGDLIVEGNLTTRENIIVKGKIVCGGDFTAGHNVIASSIKTAGRFGCYANVRIKSSLEAGWFWVDGNLHAGDVSAKETSTVHGWMKASTVDGNVLMN